MFIETFVVAVTASLIRGGKLKNLEKIEFRYWYFLILGFIIQSIPGMLCSFVQTHFPLFEKTFTFVFVGISYLFILFPLLININVKGAYFALAGTALNAAVILSNNSMMPVSKTAIMQTGYEGVLQTGQRLDLMHYVADGATRLFMFSDYIPIPKPYPFPQVISIGDILICIGLFIYISNVLIKKDQDLQTAS